MKVFQPLLLLGCVAALLASIGLSSCYYSNGYGYGHGYRPNHYGNYPPPSYHQRRSYPYDFGRGGTHRYHDDYRYRSISEARRREAAIRQRNRAPASRVAASRSNAAVKRSPQVARARTSNQAPRHPRAEPNCWRRRTTRALLRNRRRREKAPALKGVVPGSGERETARKRSGRSAPLSGIDEKGPGLLRSLP